MGDFTFAVIWYVVAYLVLYTFRVSLMELPTLIGVPLIVFAVIFPFVRKVGIAKVALWCFGFGVAVALIRTLLS